MAERFSNPVIQYLDTNGDPLGAGKLYFYESGTSTPLDTYSDEALTTPNTNPVVLDGDGRTGSIFLQNAQYKVKLDTAADVNVWERDPVASAGDVIGGKIDSLKARIFGKLEQLLQTHLTASQQAIERISIETKTNRNFIRVLSWKAILLAKGHGRPSPG